MNKKAAARKRAKATFHTKFSHQQKIDALAESTAKAKSARKGVKGVQAEMEKRGYLPDGRGSWRRMAKQESKMYESRRDEVPTKNA